MLNDRLKLVAGARYDRTAYSPRLAAQFTDNSNTVRDVDFAAPTWQLTGEFGFTPSHSVWARVGQGFPRPIGGGDVRADGHLGGNRSGYRKLR